MLVPKSPSKGEESREAWHMPVKRAMSAKYMVSHFAERLEQMNNQAVPPFFFCFCRLPSRRADVLLPASCVLCTQKSMSCEKCLLKCASLLMVFPSISVSPPLHPLHLPPPPYHEDPTSLGRDVLPLKLHGEFCLSPPWLPQQHATVHSTTAHRLFHLSFISWYIFLTHAAAFVQTFLRGLGGGIPKRSVFYFLIFLCLFLIIAVCMFCGRMIQHVPIRVRFNTYLILYHSLWFLHLSLGLILV